MKLRLFNSQVVKCLCRQLAMYNQNNRSKERKSFLPFDWQNLIIYLVIRTRKFRDTTFVLRKFWSILFLSTTLANWVKNYDNACHTHTLILSKKNFGNANNICVASEWGSKIRVNNDKLGHSNSRLD